MKCKKYLYSGIRNELTQLVFGNVIRKNWSFLAGDYILQIVDVRFNTFLTVILDLKEMTIKPFA